MSRLPSRLHVPSAPAAGQERSYVGTHTNRVMLRAKLHCATVTEADVLLDGRNTVRSANSRRRRWKS